MYHCCLTSNEQHCIYIHEFMTKTSLQTMQIVLVKRSLYDQKHSALQRAINDHSQQVGVILVVRGISLLRTRSMVISIQEKHLLMYVPSYRRIVKLFPALLLADDPFGGVVPCSGETLSYSDTQGMLSWVIFDYIIIIQLVVKTQVNY